MNGDSHGDTDGEQDVKRWLGSALSDEPPLALDRAKVFRRGRRELRNRKLFQAGGAATGVVAVVVGAVLVGGLVDGEPPVPPAATGTAPTSTTTEPGPPSSQPVSQPESPTTTTDPPIEVDGHADRLTEVLTKPGLLPAGSRLDPSPGATIATFRKIHPGVYGLESDLHTADGSGWLWVLVEKGPGVGATCEVIQEPVEHCKVREELGMPMTIAVQKFDSGEIRRVVRSSRPDGCYVTVTSSNLTAEYRDKGVRPLKPTWPPLPEAKMIEIAARPGLTVG